MKELARLVVPALRWDAAHGFGYLDGLIEDALELGVGGFVLDGAPPRDEAARLAARLHAGSAHPILIAAKAERGAGEAIEGLTQLPPLGAVSAAALVHGEAGTLPSLDVGAIRRAARITARELRSVGVNWALAPACDLDVPHGFERVGVRGASDDPAVAAAVVSEWVDACHAESTVACAMHFPGLGNARIEGGVSVVARSEFDLRHSDLVPFAAAVDAGVASVMIAAAIAPALGAHDGVMRSADAISRLLRAELEFDGIAVTAPLGDEPGIVPTQEAAYAVGAVAAGCDVVLAPGDLDGTVLALERAALDGVVAPGRARKALDRVARWAGWARLAGGAGGMQEPAGVTVSLDDTMWSRQIADRACQWLSGGRPRIGAAVEVLTPGTPMPHVTQTLRALHVEVTESNAVMPGMRAPLVVCFAPPAGPGDAVARGALEETRRAAHVAIAAGRDVAVIAACHPRAAGGVGSDVPVVCIWEPTRAMQEAGTRALFTRR